MSECAIEAIEDCLASEVAKKIEKQIHSGAEAPS